MNNNNQNKINWQSVFNLKVIENYLKSCELKEISLVNKGLRENLKKKLFYHINVTKYSTNPEKYRFIPNNGDDEAKKKAEEFLSVLYPANLFAEEVNCNNLISPFLLKTLVSACLSLKKIKLHHTYIPITTLKSIFESLNSIEIISLFGITAIQWTNSTLALTDIALPRALKSLIIIYCKNGLFEYTDDPRDFKYHNQIFGQIGNSPFLFNSSSLSRLNFLSIIQNEENSINSINNFLRNQHTLKSLKLEGYVFNQSTVDILASLPGFEELYLLGNRFDFQFSAGNIWQVSKFPVFSQLKKLSLDYLPAYKNVKTFISSFHNLVTLEVQFEEEIIDLFLNAINLKKLIIVCNFLGKLEYKLPSNNLDIVVVDIIDPMLINFKLLISSSNIKLISIKFDNKIYQDKPLNGIVDYYSNIEGWSFKFYYSCIICYKNM
jgi:hypothetical protein